MGFDYEYNKIRELMNSFNQPSLRDIIMSEAENQRLQFQDRDIVNTNALPPIVQQIIEQLGIENATATLIINNNGDSVINIQPDNNEQPTDIVTIDVRSPSYSSRVLRTAQYGDFYIMSEVQTHDNEQTYSIQLSEDGHVWNSILRVQGLGDTCDFEITERGDIISSISRGNDIYISIMPYEVDQWVDLQTVTIPDAQRIKCVRFIKHDDIIFGETEDDDEAVYTMHLLVEYADVHGNIKTNLYKANHSDEFQILSTNAFPDCDLIKTINSEYGIYALCKVGNESWILRLADDCFGEPEWRTVLVVPAQDTLCDISLFDDMIVVSGSKHSEDGNHGVLYRTQNGVDWETYMYFEDYQCIRNMCEDENLYFYANHVNGNGQHELVIVEMNQDGEDSIWKHLGAINDVDDSHLIMNCDQAVIIRNSLNHM